MTFPEQRSPAADGPSFAHVLALTDRFGTFEHADHTRARREHGYCLDDVARVLLVAAREPEPSTEVRELARGALRFVAAAQGVTGKSRNRRGADGRWHGPRGLEDCWGRSVWALGVAASHGERWLKQDALALFEHACQWRPPSVRTMAFAVLGAAEVVAVQPWHRQAQDLLLDGARSLPRPTDDPWWPWPEARLAYANALVPDALLAAGAALDDAAMVADGLALLGWLLERETRDGHLSVTPAGGTGPGEVGPAFDQQPIEVATLAEACARAFALTGDAEWAAAVARAGRWFDGDNDTGAVMWDPATGGGFDGLTPDGPNQNQGAESTLALVATRQLERRFARLAA